MDYSKYIQMKMQAANTYKSYWQPRDASEVTLRKVFQAQNTTGVQTSGALSNLHQGPAAPTCCPEGIPNSADPPANGFSTDYSQDQTFGRIAGNTICQDPNWNASGGVTLIGCDQVATILTIPANPVKSSARDCCADPGVVQRGVVTGVPVPYTGVYNQIPAGSNGVAVGNYPLYPS